MTIKFYSATGEYGCFSNFSPHPFSLGGKRWPTSEHYFQSQKFLDAGLREEIRKAKTPMIAARVGRSRKKPLRRDWDSIKVGVMREAVRRKFETHADIRATLLATGEEVLIEDAPDDEFWGCGPDGSGKNMLGRILMQLRAEFREAPEIKIEDE